MRVHGNGARSALAGLVAIAAIAPGCHKQMKVNSTGEDPFQPLRDRMVTEQIAARGVRDQRVLNALRTVPRHRFVPKHLHRQAYDDNPLPIGHGQTISQPYIVGYMSAALTLKGTEKVLEIGTGSGYQAAILSKLADKVYTIEIVKPLADESKRLLSEMGFRNVEVRFGDGYQGWKEHAPFDAIILTASPPRIPKPLLDQLKVGGRLVAPVGKHEQELILVTRTPKGLQRQRLFGVRFVPMTGKAQERD